MKDFYLSNDEGKFGDIVFDEQTLVVNDSIADRREVTVKVLKTVENESKLLQSLKKILLNDTYSHPLNFGVDHTQFSVDEIVQALTFYNGLTQTVNPLEIIGEIVSIKQQQDFYEIVVKTLTGSLITLTVGA